MIVFIDYDSTLNNMSYAWLKWLNDEHGRKYTNEDVTHWDWYTGLDIDAFAWFKDGIAFDLIDPLPLSQEFFAHVKDSFETVILTASHENMLIPKNAHILEHYGECEVIHHHAKWDYAVHEHKLCVLIDDRPLNCIKWVEAGGVAFLFNHENNYLYAETDFEHPQLHRVDNYEDIKLKLKELK